MRRTLVAFSAALCLVVLASCTYNTRIISAASGESRADAIAQLEQKIKNAESQGCVVKGIASARSFSIISDCPECNDAIDTDITFDALLRCRDRVSLD